MSPQILLLLSVVGAEPVRPVDFDTEVVPVLTKAGCNAGSCHGAAAGRGGFHLSLFGSDAAADREAIVEELEGRRTNLARPSESLVLTKPTGILKHGGGERLDMDGEGAKRLLDWITLGASRSAKPRRLTSFEIQPGNTIVKKLGDEVALVATARFDDGPAENVTAWTVFTSTDTSAVEVTGNGKATIRRRGQHVVIARFLDRVVPIRLTLPFADMAIDLAKEPRANFIDNEILKTLEVLSIPVSSRADDAAFLRRIRLDLTGRLPTPEEVTLFLKDSSNEKRTKRIDELLASGEFVEYWTFKLANLVRNRPQPAEVEGMRAFHGWLRDSLKNSTPFDKFARDALTALGDSHTDGAAYFSRLSGDARSQAEHVSEVFLGVRLQCANCHNHPLDRWSQDDYHGLAAIFAKLERGRVVKVGIRGAITNPRSGDPAVPRIPGTKFLDASGDGRPAFAAWLTAADNPFFARAIVNRLWKAMFGTGMVEPVDDLRETNPATHPELLGRLAADFVKHGFNIRHTLRLISASNAYGRSADSLPANKDDERFYSHANRRPLDAAVLADALADVTGIADKFGEEPAGTRAISLINPLTPSRTLDVLGRCSRQASCESGAMNGGVAAMLHRLNGELINRKIESKEGRLHRMIAAGKSTEEILAEFYIRALGRSLTDAELQYWKSHAEKVKNEDRTTFLEDSVWGILNSREFWSNH